MNVIPAPLLHKLNTVPGFDEVSFTKAHQLPAVTSVRMHPAKHSQQFENSVKVPWCGEGRYLDERPIFTLDPAYHAGAYYVQEASSMFTGYVFSQVTECRRNFRVLDLCAAPGGKSTHIASLLDEGSLLISNDVIRSRATILEENMTRWGYMNTWVTSNDPVSFGALTGYFDVILVDAPCSGSGLFRKDIRALHDWTESNVKLCCERQQRIIANIMPALKQGGILLYATCSYSPEEDEEILDWAAKNYNLTGINVPVKEEWGVVKTESQVSQLPGYHFFPDKLQGEGFFIAALQKNEATNALRIPRYKIPDTKSIPAQVTHLLQNPGNNILVKNEATGAYSAIRPEHYEDTQLLQNKLYFRKTGTVLGAPGAKEWIPEHDTALSIHLNPAIPCAELTKEQALRFLKKEDIGMSIPGKGWYVMRYLGLGLGWVKSLGNRQNNYLPKSCRIRMEIEE